MVRGVDALRLDGRVAIVTGAGNGLGRAYALELARRGARVLVNNRRRPDDAGGATSAEKTVAAIRAGGGEALPDWEDVRDPDSGLRMVDRAIGAWGRLDALVNNAGVGQHLPFHRLTIAQFRDIFDVNFYGSLYVTHAAFAHMRTAGYGRIVVSTSAAGLHGLHGLSAYSASKAALLGLMRSLAQEGARCGVHCNAVAPYAYTGMTAANSPPDRAATMPPGYVAPLIAWFASERCALNGEVIVAGKGAFRRAFVSEGPGVAYTRAADLCAERLAADAAAIEAISPALQFADALAAFDQFYASAPGVRPC